MGLPVLAVQLLAIANITVTRNDIFRSLATRTQFDHDYDYVVIGGGTAGAIVAARLSENSGHHVLLIEAGGQESVQGDMPGMFHMDFVGHDMDEYQYKTVPQIHSMDREFGIFRGKFLGGCSANNALAYIRGSKHLYEEWATVYGAKGWTYEEVTNVYKKFERQTDPKILEKHSEYHGTTGPVSIRSPIQTNIEKKWFKLLVEMGYKVVDDINDPNFGDKNLGMIQQTINNGRRQSTSSAYLEPNRKRDNLHISTNSTATKILFQDPNHHKRATGVQYYHNGKLVTVKARREVILSAGTIASPQILMLSGIGIESHLKSLGIPVIADLPVGDNLHDGIQAYFDIQSSPIVENTQGLKNLLSVDSMHEFYTKGTGPLTVINLHTAFFNTKYNTRPDWPDAAVKASTNLLSDGFNIIENLSVGIQILKPLSRGTLRLKTTNPFDQPLIDPNIHSHPQDIKSMAGGLRELSRIVSNSTQFKQLAHFKSKCDVCTVSPTNECEEYFECLAKEQSYPCLHIAGTCRMGSASDPKAVVDERLRVRGVEHLRVIDASIMPQNSEPGTYTPAMMIGEKGVQMVLEDNPN